MLPNDAEGRALFRSRLSETVAWCSDRLRIDDPAGSLRTLGLKPDVVVLESENDGSWDCDFPDPVSDLNQLCRRRAAIARSGDGDAEAHSLPDGRLLLFYPHESLCDGAARYSSNGYFDNWNIPPWDTWLWCGASPLGGLYLYSWIPPEFVELATVGVSVNPEECLQLLGVEWRSKIFGRQDQ